MKFGFLVFVAYAAAHAPENCDTDEATMLQGGIRGRQAKFDTMRDAQIPPQLAIPPLVDVLQAAVDGLQDAIDVITAASAPPMILNDHFQEFTVDGAPGTLADSQRIVWRDFNWDWITNTCSGTFPCASTTSGLCDGGTSTARSWDGVWTNGCHNLAFSHWHGGGTCFFKLTKASGQFSDGGNGWGVIADGGNYSFMMIDIPAAMRGDDDMYVYQDFLQPFTQDIDVAIAVSGGADNLCDCRAGYRIGLYLPDGTLWRAEPTANRPSSVHGSHSVLLVPTS